MQGPRLLAINDDFFGRGIFNADGDLWVHQRKVAAIEFAPIRLRTFSTQIFADYATRLARRVLDKSKLRTQTDLQVSMNCCIRTSLDCRCKLTKNNRNSTSISLASQDCRGRQLYVRSNMEILALISSTVANHTAKFQKVRITQCTEDLLVVFMTEQ